MQLKVTKMEALGNDYIIINGWEYGELIRNAEALSRKLSDRHFGIGGDGIIFALPSQNADAMMRIFNADGSEAEMCGNGIRQAAKFLFDNGIVDKKTMRIETLAGVKTIAIKTDKNGKMKFARVDMGAPILEPEKIPAIAQVNNEGFAEILINGLDYTLVSMGNPHAVTFIESADNFPVEKIGRNVENNTDIFPSRTNVEFIEVLSDSEIKMRVWERGSGETLACGTGACASVVACVLNGKTGRNVKVNLLGGTLDIEWAESGTVFMTGSANIVFNADLEI
jgi:diaminopimelate epimerase